MAEFQIIRALFELFPYRMLSLNHELLALPLAFSVPVIAGSLQIFVYVTQGTICTPAPTANSLYKLDICLGKKYICFTGMQTDLGLYLIIVGTGIFLRFNRLCRKFR